MKLTEIKRENIIKAAVDEFKEHGFLGAKTTRIAKRAEVSSRTLYNHFESKEALFNAIAEKMIAANSVMKPVSLDKNVDIAEQLYVALKQYIQVITDVEAMGLNRMVISEIIRDVKQSRAFFAEFGTHDYPVTQLISDAMDAGILRKADAKFATEQLLSMVKGAFYWPEFFLGENFFDETKLKDCIQMFLCHYKA